MSIGVCFLWDICSSPATSMPVAHARLANQLLATIALAVATTYLLKASPKRVYALCTGFAAGLRTVTVFSAVCRAFRVGGPNSAARTTLRKPLHQLMCGLASVMLALTGVITWMHSVLVRDSRSLAPSRPLPADARGRGDPN